jgi:hypothetical protein
VLENVHFDGNELKDYMDYVGRDLFTAPLLTTLRQFEEADNFGSLIRPDVTDVDGMIRILKSKNVSGQLFISMTHQKVLQALRQADYLSPKYHVVIANPPYMGGRNMNPRLKEYLASQYAEFKFDLFSAFIVRNIDLAKPRGLLGFMTPFVWMFISSYVELREHLLGKHALTSLVQLEYSGFDGATVPICVFTVCASFEGDYLGNYIRLTDFRGSKNQGPRTLEAIRNPNCGWHFTVRSNAFSMVPGSPIAYWISDNIRESFSDNQRLGDHLESRHGLVTASNELFVRLWHEVPLRKFGLSFSDRNEAKISGKKWFPYLKGGPYRKWYGNCEHVVDWEDDGFRLQSRLHPSGRVWATNFNLDYIFSENITWSDITSAISSFRYTPPGYIFDAKGPSAFTGNRNILFGALALLNSNLTKVFTKVLNPSLSFQSGNFDDIPFAIKFSHSAFTQRVEVAVRLAKSDWNNRETSWKFNDLPLLQGNFRQPTLEATYQKLRAHWREMTLEMQQLEEENNRIFIEAYGLQDELTPEVPLSEITLTCNPHYRYGNDKSDDELESLLLADTMRELVSYAVGCMFGRYALDKPGLILANQGETFEDYLQQVPEPSFPADDDNVIPILDGDWFTDDITERFRKFLRVTFGDEHYEENLRFVERALNIKGKRNYGIRDYFLGEFYTDHVKRYKKRPIYWLFSSPKGSFNALIYMHRYRPDTVSIVLNEYLREFRTKLTAEKNHQEQISISASVSASDKTKALRETQQLNKMIKELEDYEREVIYPLATQQVEIDLDDGVKVNYPKFGKALKKIPGLEAKED